MPELKTSQLHDDQVKLLAVTLARWAKSHPRPDEPILAFADGRALSPRQLVLEVEKRTKNGEAFLRIVRCGLELRKFDEILASFNHLGKRI